MTILFWGLAIWLTASFLLGPMVGRFLASASQVDPPSLD